jgi:hypothetical protein
LEADKRKDARVPSYAKAVLVDGQVPGYIRDLSPSGCQVAFLQPPRVGVGDVLTIQVIAEHDPTILPFRIRLRVRRLIEDPPWHSVGAQIEQHIEAEEAEAFEKLVSYYSGAGA